MLRHTTIYSFSVLCLLWFRRLPQAGLLWVGLLWHDDLCFSGHTCYRQKNEFLYLFAWLVLSTMAYFIQYERNNQVFHRAFHPHHVVSEIIELIWSRLVEKKPKYHILATLKFIWRLLKSWGTTSLLSFKFHLACLLFL